MQSLLLLMKFMPAGTTNVATTLVAGSGPLLATNAV